MKYTSGSNTIPSIKLKIQEQPVNQKILLSGNEAVAQGARAAGVGFASAYPGTPSTEILENIAKLPDIHAQWSPNEKVAFEVGIGASLGGARTIVCMKHVGVNVAADPLMTLAYTGIKGGFVLVSADDPEMHSSQNEQDNRTYAKFAKIPMLEPSDSQECYDFMGEALEISERFDTPVLLRMTTRISHSMTAVNIKEWQAVEVTGFEKDIDKYVMMPNFARPRHQVILKRLERLQKFSEETSLNRIEWGDKKIGVISSGVSYQHAREAFPEASFFKLGFSYPMPLKKIAGFTDKVEKLIVVEELEPFIEDALKNVGIPCEGKKYFPIYGELNPSLAEKGFMEAGFLTAIPDDGAEPVEVLPRPPVLCPGCSHRSVFYALKRMGAHVFGDIGCYTMAALPPLEALHACVCMGASIGMATGISQVQGSKRPVFAVIGDSTFLHSGITGVLDAVYNKANVTILILDNRITAMTGGQQHPATGKTLMGEDTKAVDFVALTKALGVEYVEEFDPYDYPKTQEILKSATKREGVKILITTRPCMLFPGKIKDESYRILAADCNGCGVCFKIGCPAISKSGDVTDKNLAVPVIDETLCTGCDLCAEICPVDCIFPVSELQKGEEVTS
ncbi:indolepyruvate ferredoxin oxidoreductase subunit alpha [candidate division LCP-89 bacterium B3_LCP]|uniref:Indolepyruvate oxidoreductase subunit IorA n=1 Tax=candidate division LCP-89 bacterium B3_LCP TaxID=2012998 RepID=A0A532UYR7_UNCL8|nr:MAG: indolepyruvate ferredoxin oxidoreductase subunit alpha [candidate division LCP-89 bacterium B3_LCP]